MPRRNKRSRNTDMSAMPYGPGGRDCVCCGDAPGKARVAARRAKKRSKRQELRSSLKGYYRSAREYYEYED